MDMAWVAHVRAIWVRVPASIIYTDSMLKAQTSRRGSAEQVLLVPLNKWPLPAQNQCSVASAPFLPPLFSAFQTSAANATEQVVDVWAFSMESV